MYSIDVSAQQASFKESKNIKHYVETKCPCDSQASGDSWNNHRQYLKCVTKTVIQLLAHQKITWQQAKKIEREAYTSSCGVEQQPTDSIEEGSEGNLTLLDNVESKFNPLNVKLNFSFENANFSTIPENHVILINNIVFQPSDLTISSKNLSFTANLKDGFNNVSVAFLDDQNTNALGDFNLWAGQNSLTINVVDQNSTPISNANVKIVLGDDSSINAQAIAQSGKVVFSNVPSRTIIATAETANNLFGSSAGLGNESLFTVQLNPFNSPSNIDNNNFSLGTAGWNIGTAPVTIIPHEENIPTLKVKKALAETDNDLKLATSGEGKQQISRTFKIAAGTKNVSIRYRFVTSEVPGGYFGSQFNDYFSVDIKSLTEGKNSHEENNMNNLGLEAFDYSSGATAWREVSLPVNVKGDNVQVDVAVANVADGLYDSYVIVDIVDEKSLSIESLELRDPDLINKLTYLSMDDHPYNGGKVPIYGKITINGAEEDQLTSLKFEVSRNGQVYKNVDLVTAAQTTLFQPFGSDEKVSITDPTTLLYELSSVPNVGVDGKVVIKINAETQNGESASKEFNSLPNLMRYKGTNRYPVPRSVDKDATLPKVLGDDWGLPSTIQYCGGIESDWLINDISNMNGNLFNGHKSHSYGKDFDVKFDGYENRDAAVADKLIAFLNTGMGSKVQFIFVAFKNKPEFKNKIQNVTLTDARKATAIIRDDDDHADHFHIRLFPILDNNNFKIQQKKFMPRNTETDITQQKGNNLLVFPNPTQDILNITIEEKSNIDNALVKLNAIKRISVVDKNGFIKKIVTYGNNIKIAKLQLADLAPNYYLLKVSDEQNHNVTIPISVVR